MSRDRYQVRYASLEPDMSEDHFFGQVTGVIDNVSSNNLDFVRRAMAIDMLDSYYLLQERDESRGENLELLRKHSAGFVRHNRPPPLTDIRAHVRLQWYLWIATGAAVGQRVWVRAGPGAATGGNPLSLRAYCHWIHDRTKEPA